MESSLLQRIETQGKPETIEGIRIGRIVRVDDTGRVWVDFRGNEGRPLIAKVSGTVKQRLETRDPSPISQVLLVFEDNNPQKPVVLDTIVPNITTPQKNETVTLEAEAPQDITIDGKTVTFDAKEQITLRCGKSSITLTRTGKVLIRGAYLLNRSTGVNRIKGGSVQVN